MALQRAHLEPLFFGTLDPLDLSCPGEPIADLVVAPIGVCLAAFLARFVSPIFPHTDLHRSREAGLDHHLVKPADFSKVQKILAGRSRD